MANILLLTPQLPYPPHQGTSLRNFHILRALAQRHQVSLLSFAETDQSQELDPLHAICRVLSPVVVPARSGRERLRQLLSTDEPDVALRLRSEAFVAALVATLQAEPYDVMQVEGIELARYIDDARRVAPHVQIVLDCHNAETELQRRAWRADIFRPSRWLAAAYSGLQIGRLARFERRAMLAADAVIAVSDIDRAHLLELVGNKGRGITVIPNTIDVAEYDSTGIVTEETRFDLVFTGKMDYRPNVDGVLWFADAVWPLILEKRPLTTWAIVGQRPHPRLKRLLDIPGITITGRVDQVQPYLAEANVYVMTLRIGSGTRLKLIEAMASGKAIVSTTIGAEGFAIDDGRNIMLADMPGELAYAVLQLLDDPARRNSLGASARVFAEGYDWRRIIPSLDALYGNLLREQ